MDLVLHIICGICICAASGFRVFVPLFIMSIANSSGWIDLSEGAVWIGSSPALLTFGAASLFEVAGYYSPWMDNMLDLITTPLALLAGIVIMSAVVIGVNPFLKWMIVILIGGGVAVNIQFLSVKARVLSAFIVTNGLGNQIFATIEFFASVMLSLLAVTFPLLSLILLIIIVFLINRIIKIADRKRKLLIL